MNNLVNKIFGVLNAVAVKNGKNDCAGEQALPWVSNKDDFLAELADILEYGVNSTNFSRFWITETILKSDEILGMDEFNDIINDCNGRLNFALLLGSDDFLRCFDAKNYDDFIKFHDYFWATIAYETVGQGV